MFINVKKKNRIWGQQQQKEISRWRLWKSSKNQGRGKSYNFKDSE